MFSKDAAGGCSNVGAYPDKEAFLNARNVFFENPSEETLEEYLHEFELFQIWWINYAAQNGAYSADQSD